MSIDTLEPKDEGNLDAIERHYSPAQIAERLNLSSRTICRMLENEPGVLRICERGLTRTRTTLRVPESVWRRIHRKWTVKDEYRRRN